MVELLVRYTNIKLRLGQLNRALALYQRLWPAREVRPKVSSQQIRHRLTRHQVDELLAEYQAGQTSTALAFKYGLAKSTVVALLRRNNAPVRYPPILDDELIRITELYQAGMRQVDIAAQVGRSKSAVWHALKRAGQFAEG